MLKQKEFRILRFVLLCLTFILLNSCASHHKKDGPPNFYVDETKIPNAVPKVEPLSKIGNQPYYTVFGRRYYTMRNSKNYEERGIASWYGTQFDSHHTSNGERYNMLAMTAAHKTLPLPTFVEVTNLKNGRKIIVKVNDRGPFESNRLIDLSYVAAKKLGMLGHGTAYVDVRAIDPSEYQRHMDWLASRSRYQHEVHHEIGHAYASSSTGLYVQAGVFHNKSYAMNLKKRLSTLMGMPVQVSMSHSVYVVKVGPLKNSAAVSRIHSKLRTLGINGKPMPHRNQFVEKRIHNDLASNSSESVAPEEKAAPVDVAKNKSVNQEDHMVSEFDLA